MIYQKVLGVSPQWFNFGLALGIGYENLEDIQEKHKNNRARLRDMLALRLMSGGNENPLTWSILREALKSTIVHRNDVASEL